MSPRRRQTLVSDKAAAVAAADKAATAEAAEADKAAAVADALAKERASAAADKGMAASTASAILDPLEGHPAPSILLSHLEIDETLSPKAFAARFMLPKYR